MSASLIETSSHDLYDCSHIVHSFCPASALRRSFGTMTSYILFWMNSHSDLHSNTSIGIWNFTAMHHPVLIISIVPILLGESFRRSPL
jgi:hypothetical protein